MRHVFPIVYLYAVKSFFATLLIAIVVLPHPVVQIAVHLEKSRFATEATSYGQVVVRDQISTLSFDKGILHKALRWTSPTTIEFRGETYTVKNETTIGDRVHFLVVKEVDDDASGLKWEKLANLAHQSEKNKSKMVQISGFDFDFRGDPVIPAPPPEPRQPLNFHYTDQVYAAYLEPTFPPPRCS